jgi:SAM-dependent methyltransferase
MKADGDPTPYDEVRYPCYSHTLSHPDALAKQALLYGLEAPPVESCRVLELGCGDGSNIIPMAFSLPGGRFTGIDLAREPVDRGNGMIASVGLGNVTLVHADVMDFDPAAGEFDYIIAHGLFSWVPKPVQEKILSICGNHLSPRGLAFISYLAYPGAHARAMLRDMVLFHTRDCKEPMESVDAAKDLASLIASVPPANDLVQFLLQSESRRMMDMVPGHLFHDDLSEWNSAFYLVQFAGEAAHHGLQFLAEADFTEMQDRHLPPEAREKLRALAPDRVLREQYLDFLRGRRFRQTLLCRSGLPIRTDPDPECLGRLFFSSEAETDILPVDLSPEVDVNFRGPRATTLDSRYPPGKAALAVLTGAWPRRLPFAELASSVRSRLAAAGIATDDLSDSSLRKFLLEIHGAGIIDLHAHPTRQCLHPGIRPKASPVALWQAARGYFATSMRHVGYTFTKDPAIHLFRLLDGTRDRNDIVRDLLANPEARAALLETGLPSDNPFAALTRVVDKEIDHLARLGMLVG